MVIYLRFIALLVLFVACTGQQPADLKNSTTPERAVKAACSNMTFEGQVFSKKNVLNIFDCSGWSKQYPELTATLRSSSEEAINEVFQPVNETFFSSKLKRKTIFEVISEAQASGKMLALANFFEYSLAEHNMIGQLNHVLSQKEMDSELRNNLLRVLSSSNQKNLRYLKALSSLFVGYELHKPKINALFSDREKDALVSHFRALMGDLTANMQNTNWTQLGSVIHQGDSPIQTWAIEGQKGDLRVLLDIIEDKNFVRDVTFLKKSVDEGVVCRNRASKRDFRIDVGQELNHKIDGLKNGSKEEFERLLLHGLTKYLAFQEFCEERDKPQGLVSFFSVLKHAFNVLPSEHDYRFLKRIHQVFGDDRFVFLSFLSTKSFGALRDQLIAFSADGKDAELVSLLYNVLSEIPGEDLEAIAELVKDLGVPKSQVAGWFASLTKAWSLLTEKERSEFIKLTGVLVDERVEASKLIDLGYSVMTNFPDFSSALAQKMNQESFQIQLRYVIAQMANPKVQKELSEFLSQDGIFEFIQIITQTSDKKSRQSPSRKISNPAPQEIPVYIEAPSVSLSSTQARVCFNHLANRYEQNVDYYGLVNELPDSCLKILGRTGFVGQIYLWMNASHAYFREAYQVENFHSADGVWAPGMLQFIFTAAVEADRTLKSRSGSTGILANIDEIHRVVTDKRVLQLFHTFSNFYLGVEKKINLDQRLLSFINAEEDAALQRLMGDGFELLKPTSPYVSLKESKAKCSDLSAELGADPCLKVETVTRQLVDLARILKRKNEFGNSLAKELVAWIHPEGGIEIPFGKKTTAVHKTSLDEIIRFLNDLSSKTTQKSFIYKTATSSTVVDGTVLDRLEVVIRDIAFVNNFYGAYFKNDVAGAKKYQEDVRSSEKLLVMLDRSSGVFRSANGLPDDSKHRLKNVRAAYSSLVELDDPYLQADGTTRRYGPMIQSLLTAVARSSKVRTQSFNPYRVPEERVVEGHNGLFLTKVVELSGLRHLSSYVRERFDDKLSALSSRDFQKINNHLIGRHKLPQLQKALQRVLDRYLDNDRRQLNLMIEDIVRFGSTLSTEELKILEEITFKGLVLLSDKKINQQSFDDLADLIELSIEHWPEIRRVLVKIKQRKELLQVMNTLLDRIVSQPELINRFVETLKGSKLLNLGDLRAMLQDAKLMDQLADMLDQVALMQNFESSINWFETMRSILIGPEKELEPLRAWLMQGFGEDREKLTVSVLLSVLGEKQGDEYRLKFVMDELFQNHRQDLEQFLSETFKALKSNSD